MTEVAELAFYVDGIRCLGCVGQIEKRLAREPVVESAKIDFDTKTLKLRMADVRRIAMVERAVRGLGFRLVAADSPSAAAVAEQSSRAALKQLAVAGAAAGNIMLFAVPIYAGLAGRLKDAFEWISFLLFLPVLLYSAQPFYKGAFASLRARMVGIDLPITIALLITSAFSVYGLIAHTGQIYFDSTASFVFLILTTRYLMERSRRKLLTPVHLRDLITHQEVTVLTATGGRETSLEEIALDDRLQLRRGQILPVDAVNLTEGAAFDTSFVDGESLPKIFSAGMPLSSGYKALNAGTLVKATSLYHTSRLAKFVRDLNRTSLSASRSTTQADRWATVLISVVLGVAFLTFISGAWWGWGEMIRRGTALLVIACPCALAFAAPVTIGAFIRAALRKGVFIREADAFEKLARVEKVFLDKTGTVTDGHLELLDKNLEESMQKIILALEKYSEHPIAFAFREAWPVRDLPPVEDPREVLGQGVSGRIDGTFYELRAFVDSGAENSVGLYANGELIKVFEFRERPRPEAESFLNLLRRRGLSIFLLSGDRKERVATLAARLGLPPENVYGAKKTEAKAAIVGNAGNALMIGDGVNDGLALRQAFLGVAVRGSFEVALNSAGVFMGRPGLRPLMDFFALSDRCNKTLRRNFHLAVAYNLVGGVAAIFGAVDPLVAAIAMPVSSTLILLSTHLGVRERS